MEWRVDVAHVLSALENTESQRGQEIASGQQTSGRAQCEASVVAQEAAHLLQLWNAAVNEDALFLQFGEDGTVFQAGVLRHQIQYSAEHGAPGLVLNVGVLDVWDGITAAQITQEQKSKNNNSLKSAQI